MKHRANIVQFQFILVSELPSFLRLTIGQRHDGVLECLVGA